MIDVKNLQKSFGDNHVLCGINEHIEKGEKLLLSDHLVLVKVLFYAV